MTYLAIDIETGGLDPNVTSLLTGYLAVLDESLTIVDSLKFALKSDVYHVTAQAMNVNKINLIDHDAMAETEEILTNKLNHFLKVHSCLLVDDPEWTAGRPTVDQLIPLGHNVHFDMIGLKTRLPNVKWGKYVSYRTMDTQIVARFLQETNKISKSNKLSLRALAEYFKIPDNAAHTADGDVLVTIEVFKCLLATNTNLCGTKS